MTELAFIGMAILVIVAGIAARRGERRGLSDEHIREIERSGRLDSEDLEPLDVDEIRAEEDEFWNQTWDEPEDWSG